MDMNAQTIDVIVIGIIIIILLGGLLFLAWRGMQAQSTFVRVITFIFLALPLVFAGGCLVLLAVLSGPGHM
jgi:hypothetical protein